MKSRFLRIVPLALSAFALLIAAGANWPRFRGEGGSGTSNERGLPVTWSQSENVAWKQPLPGSGTSSPIVWGDSIFLTAYTGYGLDERDPGDMRQLRRHVICLARAGGEPRWSDVVEPKLPEQEFQGFQALHGYASSTPATDGERLYVFFGCSGVLAYTLDGERLWQRDVGSTTHNWGSATSPVVFGDLVIVNASVESGSLVALDKQSGREVWRAGGMRASWNTPIIVEVPGGKPELVVSVRGALLGFNPGTGEQLWRCDAIDDYVCPSVVADQGIVYAIGGRQATAVAVRAGGRGDVTDTHRLWKARAGSNVSSPVVHEGHLYWVSDRGIAHCLNAETGEIVYQERLPNPGRVYASVLLADDKLYAVTRENGTFVLAARPSFELLAHNRPLDESIFNASPAVSDGRLLLRSNRYLYAIGR